MQKLYSLQALRGVGALAVVVLHAVTLSISIPFKVGAAGVDLFFIISGVVMALTTDPQTRPLPFLLKRVIRVVPLYWIATLAALAHLYFGYAQVPSTEHIITSLFFLEPPQARVNPILYVGWSLNHEIFFYLLLFGSLYFFRGRAIGAVALTVVALAVVGGCVKIPWLGYYFSLSLLEFATGLAIGVILKKGYRVEKPWGLTVIVISIVLFWLYRGGSGGSIINWGIPAAMLVIGATSFDRASLVRSKFVQFIGDASYSIYLSHPFVIWAFEWMLNGSKSNTAAVLAIFLSVGFGSFVHVALEKPLLRFLTFCSNNLLSPKQHGGIPQ